MNGDELARKITKTMATWRFIFIFLLLCLIEIVGNKYGIFHFDGSMLVLNTILSLLAAIQGSVIMIYQDQADAKRDALLQHINDATDAILALEQKIDKHLQKE